MAWREAFLAQARSDHAIFFRLNDANVEYCHRLHYLQMTCEKLAKGFLTSPTSTTPPEPTHVALVRMLQVLKTRPEIRRRLGFQDAGRFRSYINSLLEIAARIENLSPDQAGFTQPNPEYPWQNEITREVIAPTDYPFQQLSLQDPRLQKLDALVRNLLIIAT